MHATIAGRPAFSSLTVDLEAGESIISEAGAMSTMDAALDLNASFNGGLLKGLGLRFLGGESLFVSTYTNNTTTPRRLTLVQSTPGDIVELPLAGRRICLQPGAFLAMTGTANLGFAYAGRGSLIGREGLFRLEVSGSGTLWFGAYGGILEKEIDGEFIVDTSHLVAYEPQMKLKIQLAGGIFSSLFSGEGLVTRIEGKGKIWIQTRSMSGLAAWTNRFI